MGQSGSTHQQEEECDDEDDDEVVDALASASHTRLLLEVITPHSDTPWHAAQAANPVIKNVLTEDWDSAQIEPRTVILHVYDLDEFKGANNVLAFSIDAVTLGGAFHAGVEVYGGEWSYGTRGVTCEAPRCAEGHVYRCSIPLGETKMDPTQVADALVTLCQTWRGAGYDLFFSQLLFLCC